MYLWRLQRGRKSMIQWYNPVLMKEMKLRFRSFKSFSGLLFYLATLGIFMTGFILVATDFGRISFITPELSYLLFILLSVVQMGLVMFITPGVTAGAISSEREKQTLNMLLTTTQSATQIILGKLLSSIAFIILMLMAGLPIYSIVFLFGGVAPTQVLMTFAYFLLTLVTIGSIGIFFSTITKRTVVSMISTYGAMIFLGAITAFLFLVTFIMVGNGVMINIGKIMMYALATLNPGAVIVSITSPEYNNEFLQFTEFDFPLWASYLIVYSGIALLCLIGAIKRLHVGIKSQR